MNVVDSEVVVAILQQHNYQLTEELEEADLVLVNTCSIRDNGSFGVVSGNQVRSLMRQGIAYWRIAAWQGVSGPGLPSSRSGGSAQHTGPT